jgi:hypothetical protein
MLTVQELTDLITTGFTRRVFRLELLDSYDVGTDGGDVARYLAGEDSPDPERKGPWLTHLRTERAAGRLRQRVHVLRSPLTGYLRYECEWGYAPNSEAGEDIGILDLTEQPLPQALDGIDHDFWLIDDQQVIVVHYDQDGRFTGAEHLDPVALPRYQAARDAAIAAAEPFTRFWARHPEYHQVNQAA